MRKDDEGAKPNDDDAASRLMQALRHPLRRKILEALRREPASATMLSNAFGLPLGNISYHLSKVLWEECDAVEVVEENQGRGSMEKVFALKTESILGVLPWRDIPEPIRSGLRGVALSNFLGAAIDALEADAAAEDGESDSTAHAFVYRPVSVDEQGMREVRGAINALERKVNAVEDRCAGVDPTERRNFIVGAAGFEAAPLTGDGDDLRPIAEELPEPADELPEDDES